MTKWTEDELNDVLKRGSVSIARTSPNKIPGSVEPVTEPDTKKSKFKNKSVRIDHQSFPSLLEGGYYLYLKDLQRWKQIRYFLTQVKFRFRSGNSYTVDFMIVLVTGDIRWVDTKGNETKEFKRNMKLMADEYPRVAVDLVTSVDNYYLKQAREIRETPAV